MILARELRRNPRPFLVPTGVLTLLAVLLLYPSAVLDGILHGSTGVLRTAPADLIVYARDANGVQILSRLEPADRERVEGVDGVAQVAAFDAWLLGAVADDGEQTAAVALLSSEAELAGKAPGPGEAWVDSTLRDQVDVKVGDTLRVGPGEVPVTIAGFVSEVNLWLLPGMIVDKETWTAALEMQAGAAGELEDLPEEVVEDLPDDVQEQVDEATDESVPQDDAGEGDEGEPSEPPAEDAGPPAGFARQDAEPSPGSGPVAGPVPAGDEATQLLFVDLEDGAEPAQVAAAIDDATGAVTQTFTRSGAVNAMPGVEEQATTFGYIRLVTLTVALVVVGLFLMFLTLERTPFYAVLKAVGASSRQLFFGVVSQALLITGVAVLLGAAVTWGLTHIPFELPTMMQPERLVETLVALGGTTVAGSVLSLRRVTAIDPAEAIG